MVQKDFFFFSVLPFRKCDIYSRFDSKIADKIRRNHIYARNEARASGGATDLFVCLFLCHILGILLKRFVQYEIATVFFQTLLLRTLI
jgi:hypothetical protein